MKNNRYTPNLIVLIVCIVVFSGCEDYLSELPDNRTQIDSAEKISELLVGAYSDSNYMDICETMSDNVGDKNVSTQAINQDLNLAMYRWEVIDITGQDSPTDFWNDTYKAIAQANQALFSINELGASRDLNPQKGEALLARAYAHFMLVNLWAKHYNPGTAGSDLGIPYIEKPETKFIVEYKRNSVKEVYDLIERDMLAGMELVTNDYEFPKFHFTPSAAKAFATRFYLFKGDWDKVIKYSSELLLSNPITQLRDIIGVYRNLQYAQQVNLYPSPDENANILISATESWYARTFIQNNFGLSSAKTRELFDGVTNPYRKQWAYQVFGTDETGYIAKYDEFFRVTNVSAGIGVGHIGTVLFSFDEVLLSRAEAFAMKGDFEQSLIDITTFLSNRTIGYDVMTDILTVGDIVSLYTSNENEFTPFYALDNSQRSFIKAIAELRRREFYHEGLRWFDVRRFDLEIEHSFFDNRPSLVLKKGDNRRQLQIPQSAIGLGIERNPR